MKGKPRNTGRKVSEAEFRRMWGDNTLTPASVVLPLRGGIA